LDAEDASQVEDGSSRQVWTPIEAGPQDANGPLHIIGAHETQSIFIIPADILSLPKITLRSSEQLDQLIIEDGTLDHLLPDQMIQSYIRIMWEPKAEIMQQIMSKRDFAESDLLMRTGSDMESYFLQQKFYQQRKIGQPTAARFKNRIEYLTEFIAEDAEFSDTFFFPESFSLVGAMPDLPNPAFDERHSDHRILPSECFFDPSYQTIAM
jgi:hypothetical protein